jgi:hypothetical protein
MAESGSEGRYGDSSQHASQTESKMVSTGPAARIPAEAPNHADVLLAREASELRRTEFVGPVFSLH